jgi:hypothetical protein
MTKERDYLAELDAANASMRDIVMQAGREVNYHRSLLAELRQYIPADHPYIPGIDEQIDLEYTRRQQLADRLTWPNPIRRDLDAAIEIIHGTLPRELRDE